MVVAVVANLTVATRPYLLLPTESILFRMTSKVMLSILFQQRSYNCSLVIMSLTPSGSQDKPPPIKAFPLSTVKRAMSLFQNATKLGLNHTSRRKTARGKVHHWNKKQLWGHWCENFQMENKLVEVGTLMLNGLPKDHSVGHG